MFLAARGQGEIAQPGGSVGTLCLSGSIGRFVGPGQVQATSTAGTAGVLVDLQSLPTPAGSVTGRAGETWFFQAWHRSLGGGSSKLTNAVAVELR